jgi:hypothetical protein
MAEPRPDALEQLPGRFHESLRHEREQHGVDERLHRGAYFADRLVSVMVLVRCSI